MLERIKERWRELLREHPSIDEGAREARRWFPINYITLHYAYFIVTIMVSSLVYWGSSRPFGSVSYVDSLFLVTSAMTSTGLNTRNLSETTAWQQVLLWILMLIGSPIWVSFWTVMVRKNAFEQRFDAIVAAERDMRKRRAALQPPSFGFRRALTFRQNLTEPTTSVNMPGLGTKQTSSTTRGVTDEEQGTITQPRRTISAPTNTMAAYEDLTVSASETVVQDDIAPEITRDHIVFSDLPLRRQQEIAMGRPSRSNSSSSSSSSDGSDILDDLLYHWKKIVGQDKVGRNGQFYDLTSDERERLGGTEYRALKILAYTVFMYFFLWQFLGSIALGAWFSVYRSSPGATDGANPWWTGIFFGVSAFSNTGMSLIDDNLIPFQGSYFVLIVIGTLILAGNTAYPIFLRLILWSSLKFLHLTTPATSHAALKETLEFILKYPRRVYTTLFASRATWWLLAVLLFTNILDWLAFEIMNIGNPIIEAMPMGDRIMDGLFQAVSVRAAGFVVIAIPVLFIGVQLLYTIMMYVSVYPVVITMRSSNVYEERSLGIYDDDPAAKAQMEQDQEQDQEQDVELVTSAPTGGNKLRRRRTGAVISKGLKRTMTFQGVGVSASAKNGDEGSRMSFIGQQVRGQLAHDLWWLVAAVLVIMTIETHHFLTEPITYSVFNVLFECISAYACVGLSVGLPTASYSMSGGWYTGSKVMLCLVMLRGRHRGLPVAVDRAVRLPGEKLHREEDEDSRIRKSKTMGRMLSR